MKGVLHNSRWFFALITALFTFSFSGPTSGSPAFSDRSIPSKVPAHPPMELPQSQVAIGELAEPVANPPLDLHLRAKRALLHLDPGFPDSAEADISALLADRIWKGEGLFLEGRKSFLTGRHREAESSIRTSLKLKDVAE